MDKVLLFFSLKYHGDWDKIYSALDRKEKIDREELDVVESRINCKYITILDSRYPNNLRMSYKPPFVIFYKGNIKLLYAYYKTIGIITKVEKPQEYRELTKIMEDMWSHFLIPYVLYNPGAAEFMVEEAVEKESKIVCLLSSPIKNSFELHPVFESVVSHQGLILSEYYDKDMSQCISEEEYMMRFFSSLSNNILIYKTSLDNKWLKMFEYMEENELSLYAICNKDQEEDYFETPIKIVQTFRDILRMW